MTSKTRLTEAKMRKAIAAAKAAGATRVSFDDGQIVVELGEECAKTDAIVYDTTDEFTFDHEDKAPLRHNAKKR